MLTHLFRTEPGVFPSRFPTVSFLSVSPYRCFSETALSRPLWGSTLPFTQFPNSKKENPEVPKGPPPFLGSTVRVSWGWECQVPAHDPPEPGGASMAKRSWSSLEELRRGCLAEAGCGEIILPHLSWRRSTNRNIFIEGTGTRHRTMATGARRSGKGALFWACFAGWLVPYLPTGWLWSCPCQLPYQQNGPQIPIHRVILSYRSKVDFAEGLI